MNTISKCKSCGRKGRRECPALDGLICAGCCGDERMSELACPPTCRHNPYGTENYDLFLKIDNQWGKKALEYVVKKSGPRRFREVMARMGESREYGEDEVGLVALLTVQYLLGVERGPSGNTLADQWESEGWTGLNNDERILVRHRRHCLPTIVEIQDRRNDQAAVCIDLFDPDRGRFVVLDRSTAARAVKYARAISWLTHYPHFSRLEVLGIEVAHHLHETFLEKLRIRVSESGGAPTGMGLKHYLAEHFGECHALLTDLALEYRERMFLSADVHHCRAFYEFREGMEAVEAILEEKPDFEWQDREPDPEDPPGTECYTWYREGESKRIEKKMIASFRHETEEDGIGILGTIKIHGGGMMVEAFSKQKFDFTKKMVKKYFSGLVKPVQESVVDLARQMMERAAEEREPARRERRPDPPSEIPHEVQREVLGKFYQRQYEKFLDEEVPMLDGMTPRAAAMVPAMRSRLIELMKLHLHGLDQQRQDRGLVLDIDWVLKELGLDELL